MTNLVLSYILDRELNKINRVIDQKIKQGLPYRTEAKLHKRILTKMSKLRKYRSVIAML